MISLGALTIIAVYGVALVMAVLFGVLGASGKLFAPGIIQKLAEAYTTIFRSMP